MGGNPHLQKITSLYVGTIICILGLIGNIISIAVWKRINRKRSHSGKSAGVYLIVLAVIDSGLLIFFFLTNSIQYLPNVKNNKIYVIFYCYIGFPMFFFFIVASIWMVICVTVNRFIAVVFPHKATSLNNLKTTYSIITATLLVSFAINIPHFFNFHWKNKAKILKTNYGKSKSAELYDFWAHCMLLVLIPWVSILSLNSVIIYKLVTKKKIQMYKKGESKRERQMTIILLVTTICFLVFLIWQCITQCFWMLDYKKDNNTIWYMVDSSYAFARLGVVVNSSVNFLLYCISGSMFRKEMYKMFNYKRKRDSNMDSTTSSIRSSSTVFINNKTVQEKSYGAVEYKHDGVLNEKLVI